MERMSQNLPNVTLEASPGGISALIAMPMANLIPRLAADTKSRKSQTLNLHRPRVLPCLRGCAVRTIHVGARIISSIVSPAPGPYKSILECAPCCKCFGCCGATFAGSSVYPVRLEATGHDDNHMPAHKEGSNMMILVYE